MTSVRPYILGAVVAAALFWIAYDGGSYSLQSRATLAIALWWAIIMAVVLGLWPLVQRSCIDADVRAMLGRARCTPLSGRRPTSSGTQCP